MKYIIFTLEGEGLPIAWQLQREGHEVTVAMIDDMADTLTSLEKHTGKEDPDSKKKRLRHYDGMLHKVPAKELLSQMKTIANPKDYFVFFDMNHLFKYASKVRDMGFHGNFPTEEDYTYEIDRQKAKSFVAKHYKGLATLPSHTFYNIEDAKRFLQKTDESWIIKGYDTASIVFIPDTKDPQLYNRQLLAALDKHTDMYERSGFLLEKYIRNVIETGPERIYYNGKLLAVVVDFEHKTIGSGDVGYQTGCSADLVIPISFDDPMNTFPYAPIVDEIAKEHTGLFFWDATVLIDAETNQAYFGEFGPNRPGYNLMYSDMCQLPSVSHYFESIVRQKNPYTLGTAAASVRIFNLNRSADDTEVLSDAPIDITGGIEKNVWMYDVYQKKGQMLTSGYDPFLAVITGAGQSIQDAVDSLYHNVDNFSFLNKYYRPKSDYLSRAYPTSILNRLSYTLEHKWLSLPEQMIGNLLAK